MNTSHHCTCGCSKSHPAIGLAIVCHMNEWFHRCESHGRDPCRSGSGAHGLRIRFPIMAEQEEPEISLIRRRIKSDSPTPPPDLSGRATGRKGRIPSTKHLETVATSRSQIGGDSGRGCTSIFFAQKYQELQSRRDLDQWGIPLDLYSYQHQLTGLTVFAPVSNLGWLRANELETLHVHSHAYGRSMISTRPDRAGSFQMLRPQEHRRSGKTPRAENAEFEFHSS